MGVTTDDALPSTPEDLVPEVRQAVDNGRALHDLLIQAGPRYVKALKRVRKSRSTQKSQRKANDAADNFCHLDGLQGVKLDPDFAPVHRFPRQQGAQA
jgi:hypothetical protein